MTPRREELDPTRCSALVSSPDGWRSFQCTRKWTVERDGKRFCKQHDPVEEKARRDASYQKYIDKQQRELRSRALGGIRTLNDMGYVVIGPNAEAATVHALLRPEEQARTSLENVQDVLRALRGERRFIR